MTPAYRVGYAPRAARQLARIAEPHRSRIGRSVALLSAQPRPAGCRKLKGVDDLYRIRIGSYRVVYAVQDRDVTVLVAEIGHRSEIYRNL